ncbi:hypothetical protein A6M14_00520 [Acinetobacter sp. Ac_877]|uniref:hypothetical protein n=1 Tax=Acinetobacter portensis TaxID=1839785 RepID=UPI00128D9498|nr:hypothetical protein [Acinetobacter portensis]MPW41348.1 hypothetical protein [Acinetobacter portensis]
MLFDNEMNKELQSFARNMASQLFIGGLGFLTLYRADTKEDFLAHQFLGLYVVGLLLLLWSIYLAISNVCILNHDFKNYLWRKSKKYDRIRLMKYHLIENNNLNSIAKTFKGLKLEDELKIRLEGVFIILIWFLYAFIYLAGISFTFFQQSRLFFS